MCLRVSLPCEKLKSSGIRRPKIYIFLLGGMGIFFEALGKRHVPQRNLMESVMLIKSESPAGYARSTWPPLDIRRNKGTPCKAQTPHL
jgi:hypothetical protein